MISYVLQNTHMRISAMVALDDKRAIGKDNTLLFKIPEDFARMQRITSGHPLVMGRKTFESIGRPLPKRTNIVITRDTNYTHEGVIVVHSLAEGIEEAKKAPGSDEIFIFGGGQIWQEAMPIMDRLYITKVAGDYGGDTFFPDYSAFTKVLEEEKHEADGYTYTFLTLEK